MFIRTNNKVISEVLLNSCKTIKQSRLVSSLKPTLLDSLTGYFSSRGNIGQLFETRTTTGQENFAFQDGGVSQIFMLIISNAAIFLRGGVEITVCFQLVIALNV